MKIEVSDEQYQPIKALPTSQDKTIEEYAFGRLLDPTVDHAKALEDSKAFQDASSSAELANYFLARAKERPRASLYLWG